jgi:hypothetical protein
VVDPVGDAGCGGTLDGVFLLGGRPGVEHLAA